MAVPKVKATYSLDVETVRALEETARRWRVSKSEVLRRAIHAVASADSTRAGSTALDALDDLQASLELSPKQAKEWETRVRNERRSVRER